MKKGAFKHRGVLEFIPFLKITVEILGGQFGVPKFVSKALTLVLVASFLLPSVLLIWPQQARAALNEQINYQGKLTNSSNIAVADGSYSIVFSLYTAASGGVAIWTETQTVTVTNGLFSIMLGSIDSLSAIDFNQTLYLGINVEADGEMTPRKVLGAVPAAFEAKRFDGLATTSFLRSDATNSTSTASTFLTLMQSGAGNIIDLIGSAGSKVFSVTSGGNVMGSYFTATSTSQASTFPYASSTALTISGTGYAGSLQVGSAIDGVTLGTGDVSAERLLLSATSSVYSVYNDLVFQDENAGVKTLSQLILGPTGCTSVNQLIDGGVVTYRSGLTFDVSESTYCINGLQYQTDATQVTLDAADGTNDRLDLIVLNTTPEVAVVKGTASANPIAPAANPSTQLGLTFVLMAAGQSAPGSGGTGPARENIYKENVEWTGTQSTPTGEVDFNATNNPQAGTVNLDVTTDLASGDYFQFASSTGTWNPTNYKTLSFYIQNVDAWANNNQRLDLTFRNAAGTQVGTTVSLRNGAYGFSRSNVSSYQKIAIPLSDFGVLGTAIKSLRFTAVPTSNNTLDFQIDNVIAEGDFTGGSVPTSGLSGIGADGRITFWTGTSTLASDSNFTWDNTLKRLTASYASTTALTVSGTGYFGTATTSNLFVSNSATIGSLTGILEATNGLVTSSSTVSVAYGGTGLSTVPSYGQMLVGNVSGGYTLTATSSLGLLSSSTVSSLTSNYVPKWSGSAFANSQIQDDGTDVTLTSNMKIKSVVGGLWTTTGSSDSWTSVAMSSDGSRQTAINNSQIFISDDYGSTWSPVAGQEGAFQGIAMSSNGQYQLTGKDESSPLYISTDYGVTWTPNELDAPWREFAVSSTGQYQTAVGLSTVYTSSDYGSSWQSSSAPAADLVGIAMSSDGSRQTAVADSGQIYVSTNYGSTWTAKDSSRAWVSVAMSSDGARQTAVVSSGQIYVSTDYGDTWTAKDSGRNWTDVAISTDGARQTAVVSSGQIYVSTDYGDTWTARDSSRNWQSVTMSSDGARQTAVDGSGYIYLGSIAANVGINQASPGSNLSVGGGATVGTSYSTLLAPSNGLIVEGNVGIGKISPTTALDVSGTASSSALVVNGTASVNGTLTLQNSSSLIGDTTYLRSTRGLALGSTETYNFNSIGVGNIAGLTVSTTTSNVLLTGSVTQVSTSGNSSPRNIAVCGNYGYAVNQGQNSLVVLDLTTKSSPTAVGQITTNITNPYGVACDSSYAYVVNFDGASGSKLEIFDVTTPASPTWLSQANVITNPQDIVISGNYAYISGAGLGVVDISNKSAPSQVATLASSETGTTCRGVTKSGNYVYMACEGASYRDGADGSSQTDGQFTVVDVSTPTSPTRAAYTTGASVIGDARDVVVLGTNAYVTSLTGYLNVYDISTPTTISTTTSLALDATVNTVMQNNTPAWMYPLSTNYGNFIVVQNGALAKTQIIDVTIPASPSIYKTITLGDQAWGVFADSTHLYLTHSNQSSDGKFYIYSLQNIFSPGVVTVVGRSINQDIEPYADILYSIGSASLRYLNAYIKNIYATAIEATTATITSLTATGLVATNATTTNATTTNLAVTNIASTTNLIVSNWASTTALAITGTGTSTAAGNLHISGTLQVGSGSTYVTTDNLNFSSAGSITAGGPLTIPYASSTAVTVSGTGYFGTASTTNLTVSSMTSGSILFASASGVVSQDNANFYWDDTNNRLGIGTSSPYAALSVVGQVVGSYVTATSTTQASTFPYASSTALTVSGTGYFGTASTTNLTVSSMTSGSLLFAGTSGAVSQDNSNLYWDNTNDRLGISSSTPYAKLSITNTGSSPSFLVEDSASPDATPFVIDASGNVGVGTLSPTTTLQVGEITGITNSSQVSPRFIVANAVDGEFNAGTFVNTQQSLSGSTNESTSLTLSWRDNTNSIAYGTKILAGKENHYVSPATAMSYLSFYTTNADSLAERVRISSDGNLGVGTTSPYAKLSVTNTGSGPTLVAEDTTSPDATPFIIDASGNVGIGTQVMTGKLNVNKDFYTEDASFSGYGVYSYVSSADNVGNVYAGYFKSDYNFQAIDGSGTRYGVYGEASDSGVNGFGTFYGLYGTASGGGTNWAGYFNNGNVYINNKLGIGDSTPTAFLDIMGTPSSGVPNIGLGRETAVSGSVAATIGFYGTGIQHGGLSYVPQTGSLSKLNVTFGGNTNPGDQTTYFTFMDTGKFGIASSTPWASLSVTNTGTGPSFVVEDAASPDSSPFIIDASGNVGVGTTTPLAKLALEGTGGLPASSGTTPTAVMQISGGSANQLYIGTHNAAPWGAWIQVADERFLEAEYPLALNPNGGNVGVGTSSPYAVLSVTNTGTAPSFIVEDSTSPDATPFIIDASGSVGIGTSTPIRALSVSAADQAGLQLNTVALNSWAAFELYGNSTRKGYLQYVGSSWADATRQDDIEIGNLSSTGDLTLWTNGSVRLTIDENGLSTFTGSIYSNGDITADGSVCAGGGAPCVDIAELYLTTDDLEGGDLVMVDSATSTAVMKADNTQPSRLLGIVSTQPAILIEGNKTVMGGPSATSTPGKVAIALAGRVPVKVTDEGGAIEPGDRITISSTPGVGMKATTSTYAVGVALEGWNGSGEGTVMVYVNLSYAKLSPLLADGRVITDDLWTIDVNSGEIKPFAAIDMGGKDLKNVGAILSQSGDWSISADGKLVVKEIKADKLCLGNTCITEAELQTILNQSGTAPAAASSEPEEPEPSAQSAGSTEEQPPSPPADSGATESPVTPAEEPAVTPEPETEPEATPEAAPTEESASPPPAPTESQPSE